MKKKEKAKSQVIIYDAEEMKCFTCTSFSENFDSCIFGDLPYGATRIYTGSTFEATRGQDIIELDSTTMKKIAKYNAEKDVDILIRKKKLLEDEIKLLKEDKEIQVKKIKSLVDFCKVFVKANETSVDEYIENNYIQDDDDYDDFD